MNRKQLLDILRKQHGYTGNASLADVKKFLDDNGIELADMDGALDVAKVWDTKATITPEADGADAATPKATDAATAKAMGTVAKASAASEVKTFAIKVADLHRRRYNASAAQGKTMFPDADSAEMVAASLRLVAHGKSPQAYPQKANDISITKALNEGSNAAGGYLVPVEFVSQLLYATEPHGVARKIANVVRMTREQQTHSRLSTVGAFVSQAESSTFADSSASDALSQVSLVARKSGRLVKVTNELLEDSAIAVADSLGARFLEGYDNRIDDDYILGDGSGTYNTFVGLANALPAAAYLTGTGGAWSAHTSGDLVGMIGTVQNVSGTRLAFLCSRQFYFQVMVRLDIASGQYRGLVNSKYGFDVGEYLGYPVYFSQRMPTASAAGAKACYFGDFAAGSMIGERRDMSVKYTDQRYFDEDSVAWLATARHSVNIHGDGRGSTYGPIVCLKTS